MLPNFHSLRSIYEKSMSQIEKSMSQIEKMIIDQPKNRHDRAKYGIEF